MDVMLRQMTFTAKKGAIFSGAQMEIQEKAETLNPPLKLQPQASSVSSLHLSAEASVPISAMAPSSSEASKICTKPAKRSPLLFSTSKSFLSDPLRFFWFIKHGNAGKKAKDVRSSDAPISKADLSLTSDLAIKQENLLQIDPPTKAEPLLDPIEVAKLRKAKAGVRKIDYADSAAKIFTGLLHNVWNHKGPVKNPKMHPNLAGSDELYICNGCEEQILSEILRSEDIQIAIRYTTQNNQTVDDISTKGGECHEENGCSAEDAAVHVHHDKESFSRILHKLPLAEIKTVSKLSDLCRFAYIIPEMKAGDLLSQHNLTFVTSSLDRKAQAYEQVKEEADKVISLSGNDIQNVSIDRGMKDALVLSSAVQITATPVASSCSQSDASPILQLEEDNADAENGISTQICNDVPSVNVKLDKGKGHGQVASNLWDKENLAAVPQERYVKHNNSDSWSQPESDASFLHSCPCEWFCCDDTATQTRYFVIQGSESIAAWQTNLTFDPVQFEDASLGILVHRGIYDAAKGLYHQLLPEIIEHLKKHGNSGQIRFTGHSLGGSLATLLFFMLQIRGAVKSDALLPVMTFGSPSIMCGGDKLLEKLSIPQSYIQSVVMHRDIVPRSFSCHYPDHVSEVLKKINGVFRHHPCLIHQKLLYAPIGELYILQPEERVAPPHPFLPKGSGLYLMRHPIQHQSMLSYSKYSMETMELQAAYRAFLNLPHPLEILRNPRSYGSNGSISKNHDPRSYAKALDNVLLQELERQIDTKCKKKRSFLWPLFTALSSTENIALLGLIGSQSTRGAVSSTVGIRQHELRQPVSSSTPGGQHMSMITALGANLSRHVRYKRLIASQHVQMGMVVILSAKVLLVQGFLSLFAWI